MKQINCDLVVRMQGLSSKKCSKILISESSGGGFANETTDGGISIGTILSNQIMYIDIPEKIAS